MEDPLQFELELALPVYESPDRIEIRLKGKAYLISWDMDKIYVTGKDGVHLDVVSAPDKVIIE